MYLGLDVSSSRIGCCLLKEDGEYFDAAVIDLTSAKTLDDKFYLFKEKLFWHIPHMPHVIKVFVEEAPMMFGSGSSAHVMSMLQRFNGMICALFMTQAWTPDLISANHARKLVGISFPRKRVKKETKMCIVNHIRDHNLMPGYEWQYKRTGTLKDHCFDAADAYVIARAGYLLYGPNPVS